MFGRNKRERMIVEAPATITNVQDTGTTINDNPRVKLMLLVQPQSGKQFEVERKATVSRIHIPKVGDPITVRYDAADPNYQRGLVVLPRTPEQLAAAAGVGAAPPPAESAAPPPDPIEQLRKLNELRVAGALTDAEFEEQKAKVLTRS